MSSANIKVSNTSRIFDDNNFSKFLPVVSSVELLQKLSGKAGSNYEEKSYLGEKLGKMNRSLFGSNKNNQYIEIQKISELLQSVAKYGLYTSEILSDVISIDGIGDSVKISYLEPKVFDEIYKNDSTNLNSYSYINKNTSKVLNDIHITKVFKEKQTDINSLELDQNKAQNLDNIRPNKGFFHNKSAPGLSVIQVLNPDLRACFKQSQEIDAFFNLISTLDITMAMPYVNVDFIIPASYKKLSGDVGNQVATKPKKYITASLNNLLFGADYASDQNNFTKNDFAINGSYDINIANNQFIRGEQGTIKKSEYERQHMTNAIFMAPQTMINADIEQFTNTEFGDRSKNSLIDKFRPFMSILDLSFDVRPQKGFLFYKTASLNLILYDKARMPEIAPFIKPELLNSHSSELALEYGWQHNLGDNNIIANEDIANRNPIAQFINSLKVVEKYVITNSSYTINENGTVSISLSLAMKGPVELRNTAMPTDDNLSKLDAELLSLTKILLNDTLNQTIEGTSKQSFPEYNQAKNKISKTNLDKVTLQKLKDAIEKERKENADVSDAEKKLILDNALETIKSVEKTLGDKEDKVDDFLQNNFDFLEQKNGKYVHDAKWDDPVLCNDPFIDKSWWEKYLGKDWINDTSTAHKWISLGKIITCVLGKMLSKTKKYNEIQFVFYNINGKSIRASYLNIASVPVELEKFKDFLKQIGNRLQKMSVETFISAILNRCVNQKAAAVYGLDKFFTFNDENKTVYNTSDKQNTDDDDKKKVLDAESKKNEQKQINMSVKAEILNQYYGQSVAAAIEEQSKTNTEANVLQDVSSLIDLTFKPANVVMNFDSTFHEVDKESSIMRVSFYDENDNPYEALTDVISSIQSRNVSNALSTISIFRSRRKERLNKNKEQSNQKNTDQAPGNTTPTTPTPNQTTNQTNGKTNDDEMIPTDERLNADAISIVRDLIAKKIVSLIIKQDNTEIETTDPTHLTNDNLVRIKINVSDESLSKKFINLKQMFKSYMPSLTLGQTNSALLSGNVTTNQDAKYATALLVKQNGEIVSDEPNGVEVELFDELDSSPMFVMPSQATASIIGCPLINFSQLIFMDFNTGTTVDNIYFVNGIKHSISPGKFSTELTLVQNDLFTRYEAQSTTIANFLKSLTEFKATQEAVKKQAESKSASIPKTTKKVVPPPKVESVTIPASDKQFTLETLINFSNGQSSKITKYIGNAFNLDVVIKIPSITTQQATYDDNGQNEWTFTRSIDSRTLKTRLDDYIGKVDQEDLTEAILQNARKLLTEFFKIIGKIDETLKENNDYTGAYKFHSYIINSGFRNPKKNAAVGGKLKSRHLTAEALDFKIQVSNGAGSPKLLDSRIVALILFEKVFSFTDVTGADKLFQTTPKAGEIMTITDRFGESPFSAAWLEKHGGKGSIQYGTKSGSNSAHIGGLGIYPDSSFCHYDIRANSAQAQLTLWFSSDRHTTNSASQPKADGVENDEE